MNFFEKKNTMFSRQFCLLKLWNFLMCWFRSLNRVKNIEHCLHSYSSRFWIESQCCSRDFGSMNDESHKSLLLSISSCTDWVCKCRASFSENDLRHEWKGHWNGRDFKWTALMCCVKLSFCAKDLPHSSHSNREFSCVDLIWFHKSIAFEYDLQQPLYQHFTVWTNSECRRNWLASANDRPHWHLCCWSSWNLRIWFASELFRVKSLPHCSQLYLIFKWTDSTCVFKEAAELNHLLHLSHLCGCFDGGLLDLSVLGITSVCNGAQLNSKNQKEIQTFLFKINSLSKQQHSFQQNMPPKFGGAPKCPRCNKSVYAAEKTVYDNQDWHAVCIIAYNNEKGIYWVL